MDDLVARCRDIGDHKRLCQGREYTCDCGHDAFVDKTLTEAADALEELQRQLGEAREEIDERDEWTQLVDSTPLDQFDKLGDYWVARHCIVRMTNAIASVFSKWANEDIMSRFREKLQAVIHQAFVEGCIEGVRSERSKKATGND